MSNQKVSSAQLLLDNPRQRGTPSCKKFTKSDLLRSITVYAVKKRLCACRSRKEDFCRQKGFEKMVNDNVTAAFLLTALAGLSTGIGSLIAFFSKEANKKFLSFTLGLSAGVMIYVSMIELFSKACGELSAIYGGKGGTILTTLGFFAGIILIAIIDRAIPADGSSCSARKDTVEDGHAKRLLRTGVMTALALGIHNFPEGMATFVSALDSPVLALPIAVAIAIHNIPEGIAVSIPIFYATGNRKKAFIYSFLSGLAEPVGAVIGYLILMPFIGAALNAEIFAIIAGIMVFISVDELLPSAHEYGEHRLSICGVVVGMAIMAASLIAFM